MILIALFYLNISSVAAESGQSFRLDNGLQLIVKPDHRSPIVVSQIWYKVGSSYETNGITGISHLLEHMMFKGTQDIGPDQFSKIIAALGGRENAFTSRDYTAYFETLSKQHLERAFALEADRMQNLSLNIQEFNKESAVVKEERRLRTEDNPNGQLWEEFNAAAWRVSPYRYPIIGWMNDLNQIQLSDVKNWYQKWYQPNNAILVVVGDVQPEAVFKQVKHYFGSIKNRSQSPPKQRIEPKRQTSTRIRLNIAAKQSILLIGYPVPNAKQNPAQAELYLLAQLLSGGKSARFHTQLVQKSIAVSAEASYDPFTRLPDLFVLQAIPAEQISLEQLENDLKAQIHRLQTEKVSQAELDRVIQKNIAETIYARDSIFYQAMLIGMRASRGYDWRSVDQDIERWQKITPEQIQNAARLLDEQISTVAILEAKQ